LRLTLTDITVTRDNHRPFSSAQDVFGRLSASAIGQLVSAGSSIAMVLSDDGRILDIAYRSPDLALFGADNWLGKNFAETVTPESTQKIVELLAEAKLGPITRRRQVNHRAAAMADLPVDYILVHAEGLSGTIALGTELRQQVEMQQQLINTQIDLERRNRDVAEKAARYRAQFKLAEWPVLVVNGGDLRIADANPAASDSLGLTERKLEGMGIGTFFDAAHKAAITELLTSARFSGEAASLNAKLGNGRDVRVSVRPFRETSTVNLIVSFGQTGTQDQRLNERPLEAMAMDLLPEACVLLEEDGTIVEVNGHFADLAGLTGKSQAIGRGIADWLGASPVDMSVLLTRLKKLGSVRRFSSVLNDAQGTTVPVVLSASVYSSNSGERIVVSIAENARPDAHFKLQPSGNIGTATDFAAMVGRVPLKDLIRDAADVIEKMCIEAALRQTNNNRASASDLLGLSRQSLYMKLKRYGLEDFEV
jgi:transcriptional regulator PpsR